MKAVKSGDVVDTEFFGGTGFTGRGADGKEHIVCCCSQRRRGYNNKPILVTSCQLMAGRLYGFELF